MKQTVDHLEKLDETALKMVHDLVLAMEPRTIGNLEGTVSRKSGPGTSGMP